MPWTVEALRRALNGDFDHLLLGDPMFGAVFGLSFVLARVAEQLEIRWVLAEPLGKNRRCA